MLYLNPNSGADENISLLSEEIVFFTLPMLTTDIYWQEGDHPAYFKRVVEKPIPQTKFFIEKVDVFTGEVFTTEPISPRIVSKASELYEKFLQFTLLNLEHRVIEQVVGEMVLRGDFENIVISFDKSYGQTMENILMLLSYKAQFYLTMYLERGLAIFTKHPKKESDEELDDLEISIPKKPDHEYRSFA